MTAVVLKYIFGIGGMLAVGLLVWRALQAQERRQKQREEDQTGR